MQPLSQQQRANSANQNIQPNEQFVDKNPNDYDQFVNDQISPQATDENNN
jgi:hypothetical protein